MLQIRQLILIVKINNQTLSNALKVNTKFSSQYFDNSQLKNYRLSKMESLERPRLNGVKICIKSAIVNPRNQSLSQIDIIINPEIIFYSQDTSNSQNNNLQPQSNKIRFENLQFNRETEEMIQQKIMEVYRLKLNKLIKQREDLMMIQEEKRQLQRKREQQKDQMIKKQQQKIKVQEYNQVREKEKERERKQQEEKSKSNTQTGAFNLHQNKNPDESKQPNRNVSNDIFGPKTNGHNQARQGNMNQPRQGAHPGNNPVNRNERAPFMSDNIFGRNSSNNNSSAVSRSSQEIPTYQQHNQNRNWERGGSQPIIGTGNIFQTQANNQSSNFSLSNNSAASFFANPKPVQVNNSIFAPRAENTNNRNAQKPGQYNRNNKKDKKEMRI